MQRANGQRATRLLLIGSNLDDMMELRTNIKGDLQGMHMGWSFSADIATTTDEAIVLIKKREDLEIIVIIGDADRTHEQMLQDARVIAQSISEHPHKPWISFYPDLDYLKLVFEAAGITVDQDMIGYTITHRWEPQIREKTAA